MIAAQIYNANLPRGRRAREPYDYFPEHKRRQSNRNADRQMSENEVKLRQRIASANFAKLSKAKKKNGR